MTIIPLRNRDERLFQQARMKYRAEPTLANFQRLRKAYMVLEGEQNVQKSANH